LGLFRKLANLVAVTVDHDKTSLPLLIHRISYFRHANMTLRMKLDCDLLQNNKL